MGLNTLRQIGVLITSFAGQESAESVVAQTREGERETVGEQVASWCVRLRQRQQLLVASLETETLQQGELTGIVNVRSGIVRRWWCKG